MGIGIIADTHVHSTCSFDGESSVDEMCLKAVEAGLDSVTFTDHCEVPYIGIPSFMGDFEANIIRSLKETEEARQKYGDKLEIFTGIEMGQPRHEPEKADFALSLGRFDFVLASVHDLKSGFDFYYGDYAPDMIHSVLTSYFNEIIETVRYADFDSLAHLTYPLRYIKAKANIDVDLKEYDEQISEIFELLIKNKKSLEINSSGLFHVIAETMPGYSLIEKYAKMGGRLITLGSDAHKTDRLYTGIPEACNLAKRAGLSQFAVYKGREPVLYKL